MDAYHRFVTPGSFLLVQDDVIDTLPVFTAGRQDRCPQLRPF